MRKKLVVPDDRIARVVKKCDSRAVGEIVAAAVCNAFVEDLAENPIVLTHEQRVKLTEKYWNLDVPATERFNNMICAFQRHMFLASEPEVPDEISDLMNACVPGSSIAFEDVQKILVEAFNRGQKSSAIKFGVWPMTPGNTAASSIDNNKYPTLEPQVPRPPMRKNSDEMPY